MDARSAKRHVCQATAELLEAHEEHSYWIFDHPAADQKRLTAALDELIAELYSRGLTENDEGL